MKKQMFRMLCVVLALALLAPNVFAATPTSEVPLADEATVTRVKNEIATGEITDMEDVFLVAYQYLGADISEDDVTAYINKDGTLGIAQIIDKKSGNKRNDNEELQIAFTSLLLTNADGIPITDSRSVDYTFSRYDSGGIADLLVYATHTAYFNVRVDPGFYSNIGVQLSHAVTNITYNSNAFSASKLIQGYEVVKNISTYVTSGSRTVNSPAAGSYLCDPAHNTWYEPLDNLNHYYGHLLTFATIYIANSDRFFQLVAAEGFWGSEYYRETLWDRILELEGIETPEQEVIG